MDVSEARALIASVSHWHHIIDFGDGLVTPGAYDPQFLLDMLRLPSDLAGVRVLDVGASDGFFARALHLRGAEVVCVDYRPKTARGFHVMEKITGAEFEHHNINLYDIDPERFGSFDVVLLLGVLYHLPDMLRALNTMRSIAKDKVFVETHCDHTAPAGVSTARYWKAASLAGDVTNFWSPSKSCLEDMLSDSGFQWTRTEAWGDRCFVEAGTNESPESREKMRLAYGLRFA
jgi:tRNA (mo5U34)-methyltransferase